MALEWVLLVALVIYLVLIAFGLRFPRGRDDWPHDRGTTGRLVILGLFFLLIVGALAIASAALHWPSPVTLTTGTGAIILVVLVILGLVHPHGARGWFRRDDGAAGPDGPEMPEKEVG